MPDLAAIDPGLLNRCLENSLERTRRATREVDGRVLVEEDGLMLVAAEGLPWITGATVTRIPRDPASTLRRAVSFFAGRGLDWDLTAAGDAATAIAASAAAAGFTMAESRPGMVLAPLEGEPPAVPGLVIEPVRDAVALEAFILTSAAGFEGGEEYFRRMYPPLVLEAPDSALYVGFLDGSPVATAIRGSSYRIAGIGGVSTIPAARRRGVGEAITARAALDGRAEGCIAAFLGATAMGYRLYERMGYRHVIDFQVWTPPN